MVRGWRDKDRLVKTESPSQAYINLIKQLNLCFWNKIKRWLLEEQKHCRKQGHRQRRTESQRLIQHVLSCNLMVDLRFGITQKTQTRATLTVNSTIQAGVSDRRKKGEGSEPSTSFLLSAENLHTMPPTPRWTLHPQTSKQNKPFLSFFFFSFFKIRHFIYIHFKLQMLSRKFPIPSLRSAPLPTHS